MGYLIELSINLRRRRTNLKEKLIDYAKDNLCEMYFENIEISGRRRVIHKHVSILTFIFPEDEKYIIRFIKKIKLIQNLSIVTVAYDNCIFRLLYSKRKKTLSNLTSQDKAIVAALK